MSRTLDEALQCCLLLPGLNFIRLIPAKTAAWNLSPDPGYFRRALWAEKHGVFRFLKCMPVLRHLAYRVPEKHVAAP